MLRGAWEGPCPSMGWLPDSSCKSQRTAGVSAGPTAGRHSHIAGSSTGHVLTLHLLVETLQLTRWSAGLCIPNTISAQDSQEGQMPWGPPSATAAPPLSSSRKPLPPAALTLPALAMVCPSSQSAQQQCQPHGHVPSPAG